VRNTSVMTFFHQIHS